MENNTKNTQQNSKTDFRKSVKKAIRYLWLLSIASVAGIVLLFTSAIFGFLGEMPDVKDLESPDIYVASEIISQDGVVLDKFEKEKRIPLEFNELPTHLVNGLIAKEDKRFYEHQGIDFRRTASALATLGGKGGGSTITQQLAKLLFSNKRSNRITRMLQKVKEYIVAIQLERLYTKDEIIAMYFNKFDFLNGAYGVEMASRVYFNKHAKDLTPDESAIFVAMLQMPYKYNPKSKPENAKIGRDGVLNYMAEQGFMPKEEARSYKAKPIKIDFHPVREVNQAYSAYYKQNLKQEIENYFLDYEKESGKKYDLYKDGLKIYVTLDSRMQKYAEEALQKHLRIVQSRFNGQQRGSAMKPYAGAKITSTKRLNLFYASMRRTQRYKTLKEEGMTEEQIIKEFEKPIRLEIFTWNGKRDTLMSPMDSIKYHKSIVRGSIMSMEPQTGNIKAWVGGIDWEHFKYDMVKQGKRQVGSTFKPIVYVATMKEIGYNPCTEISNATYQKGKWVVLGSGGMLTLRQALAHSKNPVAARLIEDVGVDMVIKLAKEMGITSPIDRYNTIALGSQEISLYEMVGAYGTLANYGNYIKPEMIWRVEDSQGKVLKENQPEFREVMNEKYAYQMLDIMQGVTKFGTAKALGGYGISGQVAGKTGTTNDNSDAWFMGIIPKLVTGVWVGWEDRDAHLTWAGEGASSALPVWALYMQKVYGDTKLGYSQKDKFLIPDEENYGECGYESADTPTGEAMTLDEAINGNDTKTSNTNSSAPKKDVNDNINGKDSLDDNW